MIRDRFHKGDGPFPSVRIELLGYLEVPRDMTVQVWHAAGGGNEDHGELYLGDRKLGIVGDDTHKNVRYVLRLPKGTHSVHWVLTGGTFQHNLLKFEDPQSGELLNVYHDAAQRAESGAAKAVEVVEANADPKDWPSATGPRQWHWEALGELGQR